MIVNERYTKELDEKTGEYKMTLVSSVIVDENLNFLKWNNFKNDLGKSEIFKNILLNLKDELKNFLDITLINGGDGLITENDLLDAFDVLNVVFSGDEKTEINNLLIKNDFKIILN